MGKKSKKVDDGRKIVCKNKKARFDYELQEKFEAGMVLTGTEVKSLRLGKANLVDAYAKIKNGEVWLVNSHISQYPFTFFGNHEPERMRKLLLHKKEIRKLVGKIKEKGQSLIPLSIYFKDGYAKVEIALAKGKKAYDKRQTLKQKEADREMARSIRNKTRDY